MPALVQTEFAGQCLHAVNGTVVFAIYKIDHNVCVRKLIQLHKNRVHHAVADFAQEPQGRLPLLVVQRRECFAIRSIPLCRFAPRANMRPLRLRVDD